MTWCRDPVLQRAYFPQIMDLRTLRATEAINLRCVTPEHSLLRRQLRGFSNQGRERLGTSGAHLRVLLFSPQNTHGCDFRLRLPPFRDIYGGD